LDEDNIDTLSDFSAFYKWAEIIVFIKKTEYFQLVFNWYNKNSKKIKTEMAFINSWLVHSHDFNILAFRLKIIQIKLLAI